MSSPAHYVPPDATPEPGGALHALWGTVFALANLFVAYWILQALLKAQPAARRKLTTALKRLAHLQTPWEPTAKQEHAVDEEEHQDEMPPELIEDIGSLGPDAEEGALQKRPSSQGSAASEKRFHQPKMPTRVPTIALTPKTTVLLEWRGLSCSVAVQGGRKHILQGIYGAARPCSMQALIGPSGAGKSTLLDILAMRAQASTQAQVLGEVLVNGLPRKAAFLQNSTYVPQDDNLVPVMTSLEALQFYASVILPASTSRADREERIDLVLATMGLTHQKQTLVGGVLPGGIMLRGLSGGERKRLSIAAGVVARPSLVFLDEPTSGLDSFAALNVCLFLGQLARAGHTLVASVHQPRSAIWMIFDTVTLLSQGRLMYHGPREELVPWFHSLGYAWDPDRHGAASDWVLDLVSLSFKKPQVEGLRDTMASQQELEMAVAAFATHLQAKHPDWFVPYSRAGPAVRATNGVKGITGAAGVESRVPTGTAATDAVAAAAPAGDMESRVPTGTAATAADAAAAPAADTAGPMSGLEALEAKAVASVSAVSSTDAAPEARAGLGGKLLRHWTHYKALAWREYLMMTRNPADVAGRMLTFTYVAIITGLVNWDIPADASSIWARMQVLYNNLSFFMLMPFIFMSLFWGDKRHAMADAAGRLYHPATYYLAKVSVSLPFNILVILSFQLITYGMVGMRHSPEAVVKSCVLAVLMGLIAFQVVYACATIAPSQDLAFMLAIAWTALNMLISDFFQIYATFKLYWLTHLRWISAMNYSWAGSMRVEFEDRWFACGPNAGIDALGIYPEVIPSTGNFALIKSFISSLGPGCIVSGDAVLRFYDLTYSFGMCVGVLIAYLLVVHAITYVFLWRGARKLTAKK